MFSFFRRKKPQQPAAEPQQDPAAPPAENAPETDTAAPNAEQPPAEPVAADYEHTPHAEEESFDINLNSEEHGVAEDGANADDAAETVPADETAPAENAEEEAAPETSDSAEAETEADGEEEPAAEAEANPETENTDETAEDTAEPVSGSPDTPPAETEVVQNMLSVESESEPADNPDNLPVDEFEIGAEMLADTPAAAPQAEDGSDELFDFHIEPPPETDTVAAEAETVSEEITAFPEDGIADEESLIGFYDEDGEDSLPEPLVLQDDAETVDALAIEAEMLAMAEAAGEVPSFADVSHQKPAGNMPEAEEFSIPLADDAAPEAESEPEQESGLPEAETAESHMPEADDGQPDQERVGWAARLKQGLTKSRDHMAKSLASVFGGGKIDEDLYEELETVLLTSDMGLEATEKLMEEVRHRVSLRGLKDGAELRQTLKDAVYDLLKPLEQPLVLPENQGTPFVIMMAGINGAGKTTSIGKLAKYFQSQGKSVVLAAGDTFRAAAREQLQEWGRRNGVMVVSQASGDSAAVCFDAVEAAKARKIDIVLADTAGRLPTQLHLMEEIKKVKRVLQKAIPDAPHEIMLVLDANIGQNALAQVKAFNDALDVSGLIITKLDGTAKGGVLAALACNHNIPVRYIGVGEKIDDLRPFDTRAFVDALFGDEV